MPLPARKKAQTGNRLAHLSDDKLRELLRLGSEVEASTGVRPQVRQSMAYWCRHALAVKGLEPARHHLMLIDHLQRLVDGEFDRLMVHMPPGYAKTEYVSILFIAWFFAKYPDNAIIAASNTAEFAQRNGRKTRDLVSEQQDALNYSLSADSKASNRWETSKGGEYFAVGVGGTAIGRRADLFVIDDPFKSRDEAENPMLRQKLMDWYKATVIGRMKPGGKIVLMHTRWHERDLAGMLLEETKSGGDTWKVLSLPALAEDNDPMGRQKGEPLWPEWEDEKKLARKKISVGNREWESQYQQRPASAEGNLFPVQQIIMQLKLESRPEYVVRAWDLAATEKFGTSDPDWTVGVKMALLESGEFAILDIKRAQVSPKKVEQLILETAEEDGPEVPIYIPQDPAQAGKFQAQYFVGKLAGYMTKAIATSGNKMTRAGPLVAQVEANNLIMLDRHWADECKEEMRTFPNGVHDDQVDSMSLAFMGLVERMGNDGIIKYYEAMVRNADKTTPHTNMEQKTGPDRPSSRKYIDETAVNAYDEALKKFLRLEDSNCHVCKLPLGNSVVQDGIHKWHPECFH